MLGVVLGVLIGSFRWLRSLTEPVLEFFRAIPPPVLVPLLMLLIGINDQMKVVVIISGAIWPVLLNTVEGVRAVDEVLANTSRTYRINGFARLRYLVLPAASPQIMTGIRQCLSIGLILMVISEMFGIVVRPRLHHRVIPTRIRHPGDVERHRGARLDRHRPLPHLQGRRGQGTAVVPRIERGTT